MVEQGINGEFALEVDPDDCCLVRSWDVRDDEGNLILSLKLDHEMTPHQISNHLKDLAMDVLLNASKTAAAEDVIKFAGWLSKASRNVPGEE